MHQYLRPTRLVLESSTSIHSSTPGSLESEGTVCCGSSTTLSGLAGHSNPFTLGVAATGDFGVGVLVPSVQFTDHGMLPPALATAACSHMSSPAAATDLLWSALAVMCSACSRGRTASMQALPSVDAGSKARIRPIRRSGLRSICLALRQLVSEPPSSTTTHPTTSSTPAGGFANALSSLMSRAFTGNFTGKPAPLAAVP
mmetsp:Transcript_42532/g.70732  ORF Transcript_42532/g.70732 Transcript_42532/m.70732 type:complete len:200 (-) Transcript_42532:612-1211(-)